MDCLFQILQAEREASVRLSSTLACHPPMEPSVGLYLLTLLASRHLHQKSSKPRLVPVRFIFQRNFDTRR